MIWKAGGQRGRNGVKEGKEGKNITYGIQGKNNGRRQANRNKEGKEDRKKGGREGGYGNLILIKDGTRTKKKEASATHSAAGTPSADLRILC